MTADEFVEQSDTILIMADMIPTDHLLAAGFSRTLNQLATKPAGPERDRIASEIAGAAWEAMMVFGPTANTKEQMIADVLNTLNNPEGFDQMLQREIENGNELAIAVARRNKEEAKQEWPSVIH